MNNYELTLHDLSHLLGNRIGQVAGGFAWLYTHNHDLTGLSPVTALDGDRHTFEEVEISFEKKFGEILIRIAQEVFREDQLEAIMERYPNTLVVPLADL